MLQTLWSSWDLQPVLGKCDKTAKKAGVASAGLAQEGWEEMSEGAPTRSPTLGVIISPKPSLTLPT